MHEERQVRVGNRLLNEAVSVMSAVHKRRATEKATLALALEEFIANHADEAIEESIQRIERLAAYQ